MENFFEKVYDVVKQIPYGRVMSYGTVAKLCGNIRMARQVGWALHKNPLPNEIPCYRIVNKEGRVSESFAFGGINRQIELLTAEGVEFDDNCCVMKKYFIEL